MTQSLFQIEGLCCSYTRNEAQRVLTIDKLHIPRGKLVFLLGPSGSGKSTLLETLGLMNHTIASGDVKFFPDEQSPAISYAELWKKNDNNELNTVRKNFFSFVFQQTNLMENFTAYENVALARMIKSGANEEEAGMAATPLMQRVNLPASVVDFDTSSVQLSGGQKQRLAFVRALSSDYAVLFGDEPTGNLDPQNANELFEVIRSQISEKSSAIIVSHDLELAIHHADMIIVISKSKEGAHGEVLDGNIFQRDQFAQLAGEARQNFKAKLFALFANEKTIASDSSKTEIRPKHKRSFGNLFFVKEATALSGKFYSNFLILSCILFFTFLAIGFANGCLDYLDKKLNNVFVNWLTVKIPFNKPKEDLKMIEGKLKSSEFKEKFHYNQISTFFESVFYVYDQQEKRFKRLKGRTIDPEADKNFISDYLLAPKNCVRNKLAPLGSEDFGLIVLQDALRQDHYNDTTADIIWMESDSPDDNGPLMVPIPVRSIVKQLPGNTQFAYTNFFRDAFRNDPNNFNPKLKHDLRILLRLDRNEAVKVKGEITSWIATQKNNFPFSANEPDMLPYHQTFNGKEFELQITFSPAPDSSALIDRFYKELCTLDFFRNNKSSYDRMYDYSIIDREQIEDRNKNRPDFYSVYFNDLHHVRAFADSLYQVANEKDEQTMMQVDTSKVDEKENFDFLSTVTKIIGILLVLFGAIAASLYSMNLLKMHLSKVQMNIGTFKAIGLSNGLTLRIYFSIILFFVGMACLVSFILAFAIGNASDHLLTGSRTVEAGINYFNLLDVKTIYAVCLIFASVILISFQTISKMLSKTPGDLIYNR